MSGIQLGNNSVPPVYNPPTRGSPGDSGDGIDYPYDKNGTTPGFWINWNDKNLTSAEIIKQYEGLLDYLKENPGSVYNGSILLLQFTVDIGEHLNDPKFAGLGKLVANQIYYGGGQYYLQDVLQLAAYGSAVRQSNLPSGIAASTKFLQSILAATSGDTGAADIFSKLNQEAANLLNGSNPNNITSWCTAHWDTSIKGPGSPGGVWVDDETAGTDPDINGPQPMDFSDFAADATFYLGSIIQPPGGGSNSSVNSAIDGIYGLSIEQIFSEYKGNPWIILVLLMSKITTSRDSDKGRAVNGYSGILTCLNNANKYVANMLADLNSPVFDAKDFYKNMDALKALVGKNPSLASIYTELQKDFSQINSQQVTPQTGAFTVADSGYYNYPPGMVIHVTGGTPPQTQKITVPANGVVYIPAGADVAYDTTNPKFSTFTFGQLAGMGDYGAIDAAMNGAAGNPVGWNATVKSTMTSSMTAMTSLINGQSAAINQQMSQIVQDMQALENYLKQMLGSITSVNQSILKNIQSLIS